MEGRTKNRESSDPYYDLIEDYDLIVASFSTQYGIRMYSKDFKDMKWQEFKALISGLGPDTPLGRIVSIRAEEDKEILKYFTPEQKKIRSDWRNRMAKEVSQEDVAVVLNKLKETFIEMAGGIYGT